MSCEITKRDVVGTLDLSESTCLLPYARDFPLVFRVEDFERKK